ncbi:hypothetical protein [Qipengyuania huizhouensis]|uniref:hypothetical protein n=1 Tax=Qipengyuania huizhouensis TaxID=2867245 RepID=UPI001C884426|nr:hypothetical protein [Qipengyuania huizhouensis]
MAALGDGPATHKSAMTANIPTVTVKARAIAIFTRDASGVEDNPDGSIAALRRWS